MKDTARVGQAAAVGGGESKETVIASFCGEGGGSYFISLIFWVHTGAINLH